MLISSKDLFRLPVETKSGNFLGKLSGFDLDINTYGIVNYYVKNMSPANFIKGMLYNELVIHQSQVISITKEKMIVDDEIVFIKKEEAEKEQEKTATAPAGAIMSDLKSASRKI